MVFNYAFSYEYYSLKELIDLLLQLSIFLLLIAMSGSEFSGISIKRVRNRAIYALKYVAIDVSCGLHTGMTEPARDSLEIGAVQHGNGDR